MVFKIAEAQSEFTSGGRPYEGHGYSMEAIVQLRRTNAEGAQVVGNHGDVIQFVGDLSPSPDTGTVGSTEELVGDQASIDAQPKGENSGLRTQSPSTSRSGKKTASGSR